MLCHYCEKNELEFRSREKRRIYLFPNGEKLDWRAICPACLGARHEWETARNLEKIRWHEAVAERRSASMARQRENDMTRLANIEAQLTILEASRDKLRKKYFPNDDKNT